MATTILQAREVFESCNLFDWEFCGNLSKESGQAIVVEVKRKSDSEKGVFRYLKRLEEDDIERFQREIRILTDDKYKSKNVVNILRHSLEAPYWYISKRGDNFQDHWKEIIIGQGTNHEKIVELALDILLKLLEGLIPLHIQGVVHRDIKPGNIVVIDNEPVLIDFGLVYSPEEERITSEDSAVGNVRYSPDQMRYWMQEIPPWLDVFMLSQVLMSMISQEPIKKAWSRPLDWRFVTYLSNLKDETIVRLRALTAICSDIYFSPTNASEMKKLVENLFLSNQSNDANLKPEVQEIIRGIQKGTANSLIIKTTDLGVFNSTFPLFEKFLNEIENYLKTVETIHSISLPVNFRSGRTILEWSESIRKKGKFDKNENFPPFTFYCGKRSLDNGHFQITSNVTFYVPSTMEHAKHIYTSYYGSPLPNDFLPFSLRLNTASNRASYIKKTQHLFIAMDRTGSLWISQYQNNFKTERQLIALSDLLEKISTWIMDSESWELIQ